MSRAVFPPPLGEWSLECGVPANSRWGPQGREMGDPLPWPPEEVGVGWDWTQIVQYLHALGERQRKFEENANARVDALLERMESLSSRLGSLGERVAETEDRLGILGP